MKRITLLLLVGAPLAAQFSGLATDATGSRLWFSSPLSLRGQPLPYASIYAVDTGGHVTPVGHFEQPYAAYRAEVSADGGVLAYSGMIGCHVLGAGCQYLNYRETTVATATATLTQDGIYHLSSSGRYALRESYFYDGPSDQIQLIDLASLHRTPIGVGNFQSLDGGGRQVAADGSALAIAESQLWLFRLDGNAQSVAGLVSRAAIDDSAQRIVYQSTNRPGCEIDLVTSVPDAVPMRLVNSTQPCTLEAMSADGATVLYLLNKSVWVADTASKQLTQIATDSTGISEAALSGDGRIVWLVTYGSRILRIDRTSAAVQEITPRTPYLDQPYYGFFPDPEPLLGAPGSLLHLSGRGLDGVQVLLDGRPVPLISSSNTDDVFQVPWDASIAPHKITVSDAQASPFDLNMRTLQMFAVAPSFWPNPDGSASIIHQDFSGPVTAANPAHRDEIVHVYLSGLGPVTPPVADGQAAPLAPLSIVQPRVPILWYVDHAYGQVSFPAEILFEGLAPGLIGIEQVDIRIPHDPLPPLFLSWAPVPVAP